jgi:hypothetical protein
MPTLNPTFGRGHLKDANIDADSAFNDGFRLPIESSAYTLLRWVVLSWCVIAWFIGTYVMVAAVVSHVAPVWMKIAAVAP